jgi:hypothetical protein
MNRTLALVVWLLAAMPMMSMASNTACILEGKLVGGVSVVEGKDCLQFVNPQTSEERLKESCEGMANVGTALGLAPAKITYVASCPAGQQATCSGIFGDEIDAYHYKRSAKLLAKTKVNCQALGGKWK